VPVVIYMMHLDSFYSTAPYAFLGNTRLLQKASCLIVEGAPTLAAPSPRSCHSLCYGPTEFLGMQPFEDRYIAGPYYVCYFF